MTALGVTSLERLFPDAGEFEPRTRREGLHRWYKVRLRDGIPATRAEDAFRDLPGVERCETAPPAKPAAAFNDTYWKELWGLSNERYEGIDINCLKVWDKYTVGNPDVIVAVIDGGIQLTHPDLAWNCLKEGHFNYVDNSPDLVSSTHGTHVAGTVAAVGNNGSGIAGIAGGDFVTGRRGVS
ncbi:MAG: S8 family serine peptidase, partial [Bacteroidales bacterium]|nr:S8 family serine peptidase [Bacteroidales bacterium]